MPVAELVRVRASVAVGPNSHEFGYGVAISSFILHPSERVKKWGLAPSQTPVATQKRLCRGACPHFFTSSEG